VDVETVDTLLKLADHGGSILLIGAIYIAGRASKTATDAVAMLREIRDGVVSANKAGVAHRATLDKKLSDIHSDLMKLPLDFFRAKKKAEQ
jgi:hypothetical protein